MTALYFSTYLFKQYYAMDNKNNDNKKECFSFSLNVLLVSNILLWT